MDVELLYSGYYSGTRTYIDTYTFLRLYPSEYWVFSQAENPEFDFASFVAGLDLEAMFRRQAAGGWVQGNGSQRLDHWWGHFTRGADVPAFNWLGQEVGRLADALNLTSWLETRGEYRWGQVVIVGSGQLRPTTHDVVLSFIPDRPT